MFACSEEEDSCTPTPILTTNEVSNITDTSVVFSGTIEAPTCDPSVTSQGFVYGVKTLPEITDEVIEGGWYNPFKRNNRIRSKIRLIITVLILPTQLEITMAK